MTLNAVQQTLLDPSVTEAKATPGEFKFHCNNPKTGKAQLIRDQQCYLGIGKVEVCGEDRRPLADQQAHVVPGYQPNPPNLSPATPCKPYADAASHAAQV